MSTREEMNSLAREIISSHRSRVEGVSQIRQATHARLQELNNTQNAMAQQLRAELAKEHAALGPAEAARKREEAQRARDRAQGVAQRKAGVKAQLQELDNAQNAMAQRQRAELAKEHAALDQAEARRERAARQEIARQRRDVNGLLKGYRAERAGARAAWQHLGAPMQATRGGVAAAPAAPRPPRAALARPVVTVAEFPEVEEEEVATEPEELTEGLAALRDRIFAYLADHPDGVRLVEIEGAFDLSRLGASRVVRSLIEEGKAKRENFLYFAL